jgi:hypothetical protein
LRIFQNLSTGQQTVLVNINVFHDGIRSGNTYCYSIRKLLPRLLSRMLKISTYKITNFRIVLYGCKTWPLALRAVLQEFENKVLRDIFRLNKDVTCDHDIAYRLTGHLVLLK